MVSVSKIRFSKWNVVFLFAASVIMCDLRLVELGDHFLIFDSMTVEVMGYALGVLVFAFLRGDRILDMGRIGVVLAIISLFAEDVTPFDMRLVVYSIYSFACGLCFGCALYVFFNGLNNTERLFNLIIIQLYFGICVYELWQNEVIRGFLSSVVVYIIVAFFILSIFTLNKNAFPKKAEPKVGGCGADDNCCRIGKGGGMSVLFFVYVVFMAVNAVNIYIIEKDAYIDNSAYGLGILIAIAVSVLVQFLFGKSALLKWKIFLVGSLASTSLLSIDGILDVRTGSLICGLAHSLGYITILYLVGGAARLTGCLGFFRRFCVVMFCVSFVLEPVIEYSFIGIDVKNNYIALGIMVLIICVTLCVYPVMHKRLFDSDWIHDINVFKHQKTAPDYVSEKGSEPAELKSLTPREKQIFGFLLTEMSVKQIMIELEISKGTFNFHAANLYRKLEIQSRTELFAKYGRS